MADRPSDTGGGILQTPDSDSPPGTPRWVGVFAIGALALVLVAVIVMLIAGGNHGPSRHAPGASGDTYSPPPSAAAFGTSR